MHCNHNSGGCVVVRWTMLVVFSGCAWAKHGPEGRIQPTPWLYPAAAFSSKRNASSSWRPKHFFLDCLCADVHLSLIWHYWVHEGGQMETSLHAEPAAGDEAWFPIVAGLMMTHQHMGLSLWLSWPVKRHTKWDPDACGESKILRPHWFLFIILNFPWNLNVPGPSLSKNLNTKGGGGKG